MSEKYMIPPDSFIRLFPKANPAMVNYLNYCLPKYGIVTLNQVTFFLTIAAKETGGLTRFDENLNYRAATLLKKWPNRYDAALANAHHFKPQLIANHVYGNMKNENIPGTNDGWTYRGRGMLQVTFKHAYRSFGEYKGFANPAADAVRYMETGQGVVEGSCWFWCIYKKINSKYCNNEGQFSEAFKHVGANGWEKAMEWYPKIRGVLSKTLWTGTAPALDPNPENRKAMVAKASAKGPTTIPYRTDSVIPATESKPATSPAATTGSGSGKVPDYLLKPGDKKPAPTNSGGFQLSFGDSSKKEEPFRVINIDQTVTDIVVPEKRSVYKGPRKRISKNFYRDQFECRCGCGFNTVDAFLIIVLQTMANSLKRYIHIVSGDRCETYNKKHKGVRGSMHTLGKAVDIVIPQDPITNEPALNSSEIISKIRTIFGNSVYCYAMTDSMVHMDVRTPLKSSGRRVRIGKSFFRDQFESGDRTGDMMDIMAIMIIEKLIVMFGRPATIKSAYRSPAHNASPAVGGKKNSQHKVGKAIDFQFLEHEGKPTIPSSYMVKFLKQTFGTQIYTYSINARTTHVDVRGM